MNKTHKIFDTPNYTEIKDGLKRIEKRLSFIEEVLKIEPKVEEIPQPIINKEAFEEEDLELKIGESWLPKFGILTFLAGMIFFLTLPLVDLPQIIPILVGYTLTAAFIIPSKFLPKESGHISSYLLGGGASIAYLTTLRLYYFGSEHLIGIKAVEILLLLLITGGILLVFIKRNSVYLTAIGLLGGYITAAIIEEPYAIFLTLAVLSALVVYLTLTKFPRGLLIFGIVLTYTTHFHWYINSPFLGNPLQPVLTSQLNLLFILLYAVIFSLGYFLSKDNKTEEYDVVLCSVLNSIGSFGLFLSISLSNFTNLFGLLQFIASLVFLIISATFWIREKSRYSTFIYAMIGYAALSTAIFYQFTSPFNFILLCWQSLVVISTALWFRSKYIIVANFIIFLVVLGAYLISEGEVGIEGLSFGVVALVSARILNWKRERLDLKTDQMRNAYLATALLSIPYVVYSMLPVAYVGLCMLGLALFYFGLNKLLKNLKYRWMAILTLLLTVIYLMIFGITSSDTTYKIISFLAAGVVLLITSAVYGKLKSRP